MVATSARMAVLTALVALLALPSTASAALDFGSCVDFKEARCASLTVPLDRSGVDPGTIDLRVGRAGNLTGPTLMYLSGGPGGAGLSEMLSVVSTLPELGDRFRLIGYDQRGTGRSGLLRCPELEKDPHLRSTSAAEQCAARLGVARKHYTTADSVEDMEAIRAQLGVEKVTLFGISYGTELAIQYARTYPQHVDRLILDSVVDPDDSDPYFTSTFRAMSPSLQSLCPGKCRGISTNPGDDLGQLVAQLRRKPMTERAYDDRGRAHKVQITPLDLFDLMLVTDYIPPLRAIMPIAVRSALEGDGALLARMIHDSSALDVLGSPRDFSTARYATVCETEPMPWDPGTPIDQRPAVVQQRIAALPANTFAPFDPPVVVGDEIDLCLRWPDVPRPPSTAAPLPYPTAPTLILQGGEDLRTPPEVSARVAARIPGSVRLVVPGTGHSTVSDPRTCSRDAIDRFIEGKSLPKSPCKRIPTGIPAVLGAPKSFESLRVSGGLPRKIGRTVSALGATLDDLRLVISPAALATSGGGLRGGYWTISGDRLVLRNYKAVDGVTLTGSGNNSIRLRIGGTKAAHGTVTLRSGGRLSGTLGGRKISLRLGSPDVAAAKAAAARKLAR
ncbi:alpha/beta hydrolase [Solirubrobacter soli]|uniref:alpha/beta hydrolase n=1 Tax=Solirubrobacter soli TaxID=363832 RepID=UPI000407A25B|nr:alpha/beta hydrolase [Solirubrobacter soli]